MDKLTGCVGDARQLVAVQVRERQNRQMYRLAAGAGSPSCQGHVADRARSIFVQKLSGTAHTYSRQAAKGLNCRAVIVLRMTRDVDGLAGKRRRRHASEVADAEGAKAFVALTEEVGARCGDRLGSWLLARAAAVAIQDCLHARAHGASMPTGTQYFMHHAHTSSC